MAHSGDVLLARSTLARYLRARPNEPVTIEAWSQALPWARAFVVEARRLGAEPVLALEDEDGFFRSLTGRGPVPTTPPALASFGGSYVYFPGPEAFPRLLGLGATDLASALERHSGAWRTAARASGVRGASMTVATVTTTAAARFGVNVDAWQTEVLEASLVPPHRLASGAARLSAPLRKARTVAIRHPNGTRLDLRLPPGRWYEEIGATTRAERRYDALWTAVPTGRLIVPVVSDSARGTWEANRPVYDRLGESAVGVGARFGFRDGRLTEVSFDRGGETFASAYPRARRQLPAVVELSIGLNPRIVRAPEIGDLGEGVLGLRIGSWPGAGGRPRRAGLDVSLLRGADVELDGHPWLVAGRPARARVARR